MTKHQCRQQVKSFFEKHVDQDKHEQLKETRKDMEGKKEKIIQMIKGEEQDGRNGKLESLEELVKDFHKQYESLYELYHNLTGELDKKVHGRTEEDKEKFSSSSSDSDSEVNNGKLQNDMKAEAARWDEERLQLMSENDELKEKLESSTKLEFELNQRVEDLTREKSILVEEKDSAMRRAEEAEVTIDGLKGEIKALEDQEKTLRLQLDMANNQKRETEEQLEIKAREAEVSNEEASRLKVEISQLEVTLKVKEDQNSIVLKKLEDIEKKSDSKTDALTTQLNSLEKEAEMLRAQKSELEEQLINKSGEASDQMKDVFDQLNGFQKELMTLATLKAEMESELERKSQEVSESLTQIGNLTEELTNTKADQKRILEEKNSIAEKAQSLELEVESLSNEKSKLEDEIRTITAETADLRAEIATLKQRIIELEESVIEKECKCAMLESKIQDGECEASSKIAALTEHIDRLKEEMKAMQSGKSIVSQLENENAELRSKVIDLELNLRSAERKAEELSRGNESNDQLLIELQTTIEDLKRDIEMDKDELMTIEEKNRNLEVMLRLSNQKLRVTEQLLSEKEKSHNLLEEKTAALTEQLDAYSDMIRQISEQANASLDSLESAITKKFDEDYGGLANSVFSLSEEVRGLRSWVVKTRLEKEEMVMEMEKVKEEGVMMRGRIEKLEMEVKKEKVEKEEVARTVIQLNEDVKEKEERLLGLGEEKREAIKQLCVWIEYHRSRCVELHGILLKMAPRVQRRTR